MNQIKKNRFILLTALIAVFFVVGFAAYADHSWGTYHWARTANPFTLKLGDNVSSTWDGHLATTSSDWSLSSILDTAVVAGLTSSSSCKPTTGRAEICNRKYGFNGWLGVASIWITGDHITKGTVKLNDSYFNTSTYNKPEWRQFVMCQEVGHIFGLDHQDIDFDNANLGSCMDYTSDPASNQHPNQHDYDQLELIYSHLDSSTTVNQSLPSRNGNGNDVDESLQWGKAVKKSSDGKPSLYVRDLGNGEKVFNFIIWAN